MGRSRQGWSRTGQVLGAMSTSATVPAQRTLLCSLQTKCHSCVIGPQQVCFLSTHHIRTAVSYFLLDPSAFTGKEEAWHKVAGRRGKENRLWEAADMAMDLRV